MKHSPHKRTMERLGMIPVFFLLLTLPIEGQPILPSARSLALADCYTSLYSPCSRMSNPASICLSSKAQLHCSYLLPYVTCPLALSSLHYSLPHANGYWNVGIESIGITGYREYTWHLKYAQKLSNKLSAGLCLNYFNTHYLEHWNAIWAIEAGFGILFRINEKTLFGLHLHNPFQINNYPDYSDLQNSIFSLGIKKEIYDNTYAFAELSSHKNASLQFKSAIEYGLNNMSFQLGYHNNPATISGGFSFYTQTLKVQLSMTWSMLPSLQQASTISYEFK